MFYYVSVRIAWYVSVLYSLLCAPYGNHISHSIWQFCGLRGRVHGFQNICPNWFLSFPTWTGCFWPLTLCLPENNKPPQADAGPDKELTLPVDSTTLDGSKSSDDQKIISYLWEKTQWVLTQNPYFCKASGPWKNEVLFAIMSWVALIGLSSGVTEEEMFAIPNFNSKKTIL